MRNHMFVNCAHLRHVTVLYLHMSPGGTWFPSKIQSTSAGLLRLIAPRLLAILESKNGRHPSKNTVFHTPAILKSTKNEHDMVMWVLEPPWHGNKMEQEYRKQIPSSKMIFSTTRITHDHLHLCLGQNDWTKWLVDTRRTPTLIHPYLAFVKLECSIYIHNWSIAMYQSCIGQMQHYITIYQPHMNPI